MRPNATAPEPDSGKLPDPTTLRAEIDNVLAEFMAEVRAEFEIHSSPEIIDELSATLNAGGKRLRPMLCYYGFRAPGGEPGGEILPAAASLELFHTFAIIHDDIMDSATHRRGAPVALQRVIDSLGDENDLEGRRAVSITILIGDLAFALSDRMFVDSGFTADDFQRAWPALNQMRMHACGGQYLDLIHSGNSSTGSDQALEIARLKSGSYSVVGPLLVGAALAGANQGAASRLAAFGEPLGLAFQLQDDVIDFLANPHESGKNPNDFEGAKVTYLMAKAIELATPEQVEALRNNWSETKTRRGAGAELIAATGALEVTQKLIRELTEQSLAALGDSNESGLDPAACAVLASIARKIGGVAGVVEH